MSEKRNPEEFYKKLKEELEKTSDWPSLYLYKFIVPTDEEKIVTIQKMFDNMGAVIKTKTSSNGKYTSISITLQMQDADSVIAKYQEVGKVEGVISL